MRTTGEKTADVLIGLLFGAVLIALYAPVVIVVLGAFYLDKSGNFDFTAPSLGSFQKLSENVQILDSVWNTLFVGIGAVIASTILATIIALHIHSAPDVEDLQVTSPHDDIHGAIGADGKTQFLHKDGTPY